MRYRPLAPPPASFASGALWLGALCFLAAFWVLPLAAQSSGGDGSVAQDPAALQESFRAQLEADRQAIYAMSRKEKHEYVAALLGQPTREGRRAAKGALEAFRRAWDLQDTTPRPVDAAVPSQPTTAAAGPARVPGSSIQYDTGTIAGTGGIASQMVGNRFDSALNPAGTACCFPVETSGTITMITFDMVNTFFGSAVFSLYSNVMGTTAVQVTSMARPGIMTGINTLSVAAPTTANAYMNGTFLAGIWQFDPTMTALALDTGSTGGQGFHAISLNDGAMGSMLATVTFGGNPANAIFRVQGNVATPIELMDFTLTTGDDAEGQATDSNRRERDGQ